MRLHKASPESVLSMIQSHPHRHIFVHRYLVTHGHLRKTCRQMVAAGRLRVVEQLKDGFIYAEGRP